MARKLTWRPCGGMGLARCIAARLHLFHRWNCPSPDKAGRNTEWLGAYGELAAASLLRAEGCSILRRNWKPARGGELDLVCRDGDCLVFVEVKTRSGSGYGGPRRAVDARKRALIRKGAWNWMRQLPEPVPHRYDVVEVLYREGAPPDCRRIRHAFGDRDVAGS